MTFTEAEAASTLIYVQMPACAIKTIKPGDEPGMVAEVVYQLGTDTITLTPKERGFVGYVYEAANLPDGSRGYSGSGEGLEEALEMALKAGHQEYANNRIPWPWG